MKNTDSYLLLTSLRVSLLIAGCFGIAPHKWEDHHLVLRYRRSSAFLPPIFSFQLEILMGEHRVYLVFVLSVTLEGVGCRIT